MKNGNVTPIGAQGITPEVLAQHLMEDAGLIEDVYVIAFTKDGKCHSYISGEAAGMTLAGCILQDLALERLTS